VGDKERPWRIAVVGTSGSGKTTLAQRLAERLGVPHVELDALHWGPDWTPPPLEAFRDMVLRALDGEAWTVDGNYGKVRDLVWSRADTVVWLDYPLWVVMARVTRRTFRRSLRREALWNDNREELGKALFSRESIIWWALTTYRRRKREYPALFSRPEYAHLRVVRLCSPRAAREWLEAQRPVTEVQGWASMTEEEGRRTDAEGQRRKDSGRWPRIRGGAT
jgi:adenylate kinase family enzyme